MILNINNKTINGNKYNVFDGIINGITIDNISEIKKIETAWYNIIVFIVDDVEHHIKDNELKTILATFYDKEWNQISDDEIDITNNILNEINNINYR